jgi:hypothetical protein
VGERYLDTVEVTGSIPVSPTQVRRGLSPECSSGCPHNPWGQPTCPPSMDARQSSVICDTWSTDRRTVHSLNCSRQLFVRSARPRIPYGRSARTNLGRAREVGRPRRPGDPSAAVLASVLFGADRERAAVRAMVCSGVSRSSCASVGVLPRARQNALPRVVGDGELLHTKGAYRLPRSMRSSLTTSLRALTLSTGVL